MSLAFLKSIEQKSLYLSQEANKLQGQELNFARGELDDARLNYARAHYKGATIEACQALFHSARALLCSKGYEGKSLSCVIGGIDHLFADQGLIEIKWVMVLLKALSVKENSDYFVEYSKDGAKFFLENASEFLRLTEDILKYHEQSILNDKPL